MSLRKFGSTFFSFLLSAKVAGAGPLRDPTDLGVNLGTSRGKVPMVHGSEMVIWIWLYINYQLGNLYKYPLIQENFPWRATPQNNKRNLKTLICLWKIIKSLLVKVITIHIDAVIFRSTMTLFHRSKENMAVKLKSAALLQN